MTKNVSNKLFIIIILIISLTVCVLGADLMSSYITVGSFNIGTNHIKQTSFDVYAISLGSFTNKHEAVEISKNYKRKNAGGYVWFHDNLFHILASAYSNENDAIKVKEKLDDISINSKILKFKFDDFVIKGNFSELEKETLNRSLASFKDNYQKLYDLSISLDTKIIKDLECSMSVNKIISDTNKLYKDFNNLFNNKLKTNLLEIKIRLNSMLSALNTASEIVDTSIPYTSYLKHSYLEILNIYYDMVEQNNKKNKQL